MSHVELKAALTVFGFWERDQLSMAHIKRRQRELSKRYHPDRPGELQQMQDLNKAAAILFTYLQNYHFSFSEEEFYRQNPDEQLRMQFTHDPLWGAP